MLKVTNPFDHKVIGEVALVGWDKIDAYLTEAQRLYRHQAEWLSIPERTKILKKTAAIMTQRSAELAHLIADEGGKPLIDARVEVARAIDGIELCIKELSHLSGREIPMGLTPAGAGKLAFTFREPLGPVVAVSAFNHPLNLIVHQVAPAVATGCPVLVKPADDTPLSCEAFVKILYEAGLPENWCRSVPCDLTTAEKLVTDPRVAFFSFIGSAKVGWMLRSKLAAGTRCALEHGGAAPVIVDDSANLGVMIPKLLKGGFYHSGQVCVSVQRVFAPRKQAQAIAEQLAAGASKLVVGNAVEEATECGPLIRPREVDRVADWVAEAVAGGGKALSGGKKLSDTTYAPTVLLDAPATARVSTMEIFGPVVSVYGYDHVEEAIAAANSLPFAFQSSIFSQDVTKAMAWARLLDSSAVMINEHTAFRTDWMPFTGRRQSGYGIGGIGYTMHDMTQEKMIVLSQ
jgi:acyl-CoA reductase-like NAD-dependent aldehyde dehydrogenase